MGPLHKSIKLCFRTRARNILKYLHWVLFGSINHKMIYWDSTAYQYIRIEKGSPVYTVLLNSITDNKWLLERVPFYVPAVRSRQRRLFLVPRANIVQPCIFWLCNKFNTYSNQIDKLYCSLYAFVCLPRDVYFNGMKTNRDLI